MDKIIKRNSKGCRIYLVKPKENRNAHELAEKFAGFESVDEVLLTEGDFGFLVKARPGPIKEQKELARCISEASSDYCGMAVGHYRYRK